MNSRAGPVRLHKGHDTPGIMLYRTMPSVFSMLHASLQQVLYQRLDWTELREVQERVYTAVAAGKDVLVIAPTAGGKSEAALIPVTDDILKNGRTGIACIYLSPLKALINDQEERFEAFCTPLSLSVIKWHGDVARGDRSWVEGEPPHFLMITPESLEVLLREKKASTDLQCVRSIIIDELHAFVESERGVHLKVLLNRLDHVTGYPVQRIGLSATMGNPEEILRWLSDDRHGSELVAITAQPQEKKFRFIVEPDDRKRTDALARIVSGHKALVFVNSRSAAENLMKSAAGRIRNLHIHHSSLSPAIRKEAEEAILSPDGACIICTSTLELGIDIGDLDRVVQVGLPNTVSSFLQRTGRSGRRGRAAYMAWLVKNPCELLCSAAIIECAVRNQVEELIPPKKPYTILIQQLFLCLFHQGRASRWQLADALLSQPVFASVDSRTLDCMITHLVSEGYLTADGEMLMPGAEAERVWGGANRKDLYSVISTADEYHAVTPEGEVIGRLDARFVTSRSADEISLGGHSWSIVRCDDIRQRVVVVPSRAAASGTFWTGRESGFSPLVCRQVQQIHARGGSLLPLGEPDKAILHEALARIPACVGEKGLHVLEQTTEKGIEVRVFSFSGSRFNRVLMLVLQHQLGSGVQVRSTDCMVKILRAGTTGAGRRVASAVRRILTMHRDEISAALPLPPADSWKFARVLPEDLLREMALSDYYRLEEFMRVLGTLTVTAPDDALPRPPVTMNGMHPGIRKPAGAPGLPERKA